MESAPGGVLRLSVWGVRAAPGRTPWVGEGLGAEGT